jgi:hypothetical protein
MSDSGVETHFHYISSSARQTVTSGNKVETKWKFTGKMFPLYFRFQPI